MATGARTITVVRKTVVDKLKPAPSGTPGETVISKVIILPRQAFEQGQGWITLEGWDIYILPTSRVAVVGGTRAYADGDILHTDQIRIDGVTWQVDGPAAPYDKGAVRKATLVKVKRVGS